MKRTIIVFSVGILLGCGGNVFVDQAGGGQMAGGGAGGGQGDGGSQPDAGVPKVDAGACTDDSCGLCAGPECFELGLWYGQHCWSVLGQIPICPEGSPPFSGPDCSPYKCESVVVIHNGELYHWPCVMCCPFPP
jgi:hypothetical protein